MKVEISLWQLCFIWTKAKRNRQITYLHKSTNRWLLAPSEMMFLMASNSCFGTTHLMSSSENWQQSRQINIDTYIFHICINSLYILHIFSFLFYRGGFGKIFFRKTPGQFERFVKEYFIFVCSNERTIFKLLFKLNPQS